MKCWKCGKEMDRELGIGDDVTNIRGYEFNLSLADDSSHNSEQIAYNNIQLGKYSDGKGECHVAICYECYIDGVFHIGK